MVYIIGQLHKRPHKDGTIAEYGPYYWLVENQWTPAGPRLKKLRYLGKHPFSRGISEASELPTDPVDLDPPRIRACAGGSDSNQTRCNICLHVSFCDVYEAPAVVDGMGSDL